VTVELSLVIPAYNEAPRLAAGYQRLEPFLEEFGAARIQVVVVDDGSSDGTLHRAHEVYGYLEHALFVQQPKNLGKGAALRLGVALATGANVITVDADMAINPTQIPLFVAALRDAAIVPGSRAIAGHIVYSSHLRTLTGAAFNRLVRHYAHTNVRDTQCGCKGFQLGPARLLGLLGRVDGFAFDVELLYLATQLDLSVRPIHVTWQDVAGSSVRLGHDTRNMVRDIRGLSRTRYENPVVELSIRVSTGDVIPLAREARLTGLVLAYGERDALLVLPRDGALGGASIAAALEGPLRTARLEELRGRRYVAV